jgi:hypothetical protein
VRGGAPGWAGAHGGADLRPAPRAPVHPGLHPSRCTWVTTSRSPLLTFYLYLRIEVEI